MTSFLFINDIHLGSKYNDNPDWKSMLDKLEVHPRTFLNGDIVDMSCMPKNQVFRGRLYQEQLIEKWGEQYVSGNHDLRGMDNWMRIAATDKGNRVLVTHGHRVGNRKRIAKWDKYTKKAAGAGKLKLIWVDIADDMDWLKGIRPIPQDVIDCAVMYAQTYSCKYVVLGHFHPNHKIVVEKNGVKIFFLPKGFNSLELE